MHPTHDKNFKFKLEPGRLSERLSTKLKHETVEKIQIT